MKDNNDKEIELTDLGKFYAIESHLLEAVAIYINGFKYYKSKDKRIEKEAEKTSLFLAKKFNSILLDLENKKV